MVFVIFNVIFWIFIAIICVSAASAGKRRRATRSDDGHTVRKKEDLTCENKYGHVHADDHHRYIVHEEPEEGYVILNGVKRKLTDCDKL